MAQFSVSVEGPTPSGNFIVRYRDGSKNPKSGNLNKFTYKIVHKYERAVINGEKLVGKYLANAYADKCRDDNHKAALGDVDLSVPVLGLVESYLNEREVNRLDDDTIHHNRVSLDAFLSETGVKLLSDITNDKIKEWKAYMTKAGYQNSTIRGRLTDLRTFLNKLVEDKKLKISPFGKKMMPKKVDNDPKYYTAMEFKALDDTLYQIDEDAVRILCNLCHSAGLRKDEALNVLWEDIRWHKGGAELLLRKEIVKGKKHPRVVPLDTGMIALLGSRKRGYLVKASRGHVDHVFDRARRIAGLTAWRPIKKGKKYLFDIHGLRHTFAKNYLQRGEGNLASLKILMGHQTIVSTMIYAQFEKSYLAEGIQRAYEKRILEENIGGQPIVISAKTNELLESGLNGNEAIGSNESMRKDSQI